MGEATRREIALDRRTPRAGEMERVGRSACPRGARRERRPAWWIRTTKRPHSAADLVVARPARRSDSGYSGRRSVSARTVRLRLRSGRREPGGERFEANRPRAPLEGAGRSGCEQPSGSRTAIAERCRQLFEEAFGVRRSCGQRGVKAIGVRRGCGQPGSKTIGLREGLPAARAEADRDRERLPAAVRGSGSRSSELPAAVRDAERCSAGLPAAPTGSIDGGLG